ncbi:hypothetical protein HYDPIDRAFT_27905 [Hydnomerulius pinastri MD-312]|uniref:Restriction of telomere capping protein 4 n=1 Tax=Hydnomerulius pinastri MD-312 TaxID=994086 RepID=A0A0C9W2H4_9AGAM|nr:hypothetical protein HYDPIDRAFT_27905 [Hydnomerulius pinastri MD-312]
MEGLFGRMRNSQTDLHSDASHRVAQRPLTVKAGEGMGFQDFGSSFDPPKRSQPSKTYVSSSTSKFKPAHAYSTHQQRKPRAPVPSDDSDDELLLSSQSSKGGDASPSSKRVTKGKFKAVQSVEEETVRINGRDLPVHPDFKPTSALKNLKFNKKKPTPADESNTSEPPPSSSLPDSDSQDLFKPLSHDLQSRSEVPRNGSNASRQMPSGTSTTRRTTPPPPWSTAHHDNDVTTPPTTRLSSKASSSGFAIGASETAQATTKPRPKPRVRMKAAPSGRADSSEPTPRPPARNRDLPLRTKSPVAEDVTVDKKTSATSCSRRALQEFPLPRNAKENISDGAGNGDASTSKSRKVPISRVGSSLATPAPLPLPSPLSKTKTISRSSTFPTIPPLSSSTYELGTPKMKGKARADPEEAGDGDDIGLTFKRKIPAPFPMNSQVLSGIGHRSSVSAVGSPKSAKRASDDSGAEQGRVSKRRRDSPPVALSRLEYLGDPPIEEDSVDFGYVRDPSTLCPYCDEELPLHPTPFLQILLETARKKSYADARPRNCRGLKAPLATYISVCQRHRFESHQLPIAIERGWPTYINFEKVPDRVKGMKKDLQAIIMDTGDRDEDDTSDDELKGPRDRSVFWREVKKEVKKQGSRTVVGVKGQFASFEKTQPGYYGEQGSVIIHQTLFDLFPLSSFDVALIAPLAPAEFIQRVLVPEAAVRLIAQDSGADIEDAVVTLRESAQYGVAMFPDTGSSKRKDADIDDDEMGVADQIVMERARMRRKELEEEEKVEEEMLKEERAANKAKAQATRREKAMERAQKARRTKRIAEDDDSAAQSETSTTTRARRATRQRVIAAESESDAMSVDSSTSRHSTRLAKKPTRAHTDRPRSHTSLARSDISDSDSVEVVSVSNGGAPKPTRSRTRERSTSVETDHGTEGVDMRRRKKAPSRAVSRLAQLGGENESTPRPLRQRATTPHEDQTPIAQPGPAPSTHSAAGSNVGRLPLEIARSRTVTSTTSNGWHRNMRAAITDDEDSDASGASRRSQRLVRAPQKAYAWLLSQSSSSSD